MKKQADEFEVIVLGSGLGGLIAAALLSYHNHKVLVLKESQYDSSYVKEGYRFIPFSNFSERQLKFALWKEVSQVLNLSPLTHDQRQERKGEMKLERSRQRATFQVILPRSRIDLFTYRPMLLMEWKREFPKEVVQIENLYNEMDRIQQLVKRVKTEEGSWSVISVHPSSLIKRWFSFKSLPMRKMDEKISPFSKEFREFIQLQLMSWCNLHSERFPISLASYLLLDGERGERVSHIELDRVEKTVLERFIQSGGKIIEIEGVEKVDTGWWKRRFTLTLKGETKALRSSFLILNSPLHLLSSLLGKKEKWCSKWKEKIQPRYVLLPLFLGIDEKAIPVGMKDLLVSILDFEKPYEGGNVLLIGLSHEGDGMAAPGGKRALTVVSLIPVGKKDESLLDEHLKGVMKHVHHLFPFLERYIEFMDWSWASKQYLCWSYPHFIYETSHDFKWREGVVPLRIWKNLYFVGKENFPYLGLEGEVVSGWMVGKQILEKYQ